MTKRIGTLEFRGDSLKEVVDRLARTIGYPIRVDWEELGEVGVTPATPVSLRLRDHPAAKALEIIFREIDPQDRLDFTLEANGYYISTKHGLERRRHLRIYDVGWLMASLAPGSVAETTFRNQLARLLEDEVDPNSWIRNGGTVGVISAIDRRLLIIQTHAAHMQISRLLDQLWQTRGTNPQLQPQGHQ